MEEIVLRKIQEQDLAAIYHWRNDPLVRQQMFSDQEINLKEHKQYWKKRLPLGNCYIIVFAGKDVGVAKLEKVAHHFEVDIFLASDFHGKKIGTKALQKLKEAAKEQGIEKIFAKVKENNLASKKIFEKNDFKGQWTFYECCL